MLPSQHRNSSRAAWAPLAAAPLQANRDRRMGIGPGTRRACAAAVFALASWPLAACRRTTATVDAGPSATEASSAATAPSAAGSSSPERVWAEARSGDPLELARLADAEGAHALAEVAANEQASADDRATAIRALMFVDDPTPAVEVLGRLVSDPVVERSTLALQTLVAIAPRRTPSEEVEPGAWRVCGDGLLAALQTIHGAVRRDLAIRTLHALADRGAVARASIPAR